jgi:hypothetical protein
MVLNPEAVVDAIDARWKIQDDFHRSKDLVFLEDSITCTNITAADNMRIMINIAYAVLCLFRAVIQSPAQDYAVQDICVILFQLLTWSRLYWTPNR